MIDLKIIPSNVFQHLTNKWKFRAHKFILEFEINNIRITKCIQVVRKFIRQQAIFHKISV